MTLPKELELATTLTNRLYSAFCIARKYNLSRVAISVEDAEQLLVLLSDSLKTIEQHNLVEFDSSIKPPTQKRLTQ